MKTQIKKSISLFPASHFVTSPEKLKIAIENIRKELDERLEFFKENNNASSYFKCLKASFKSSLEEGKWSLYIASCLLTRLYFFLKAVGIIL